MLDEKHSKMLLDMIEELFGKGLTAEELVPLLKRQIDFLENQMAERCGMKLYRSADGFTQEQIYEYAGTKDCVATISFRKGADSAAIYGSSVTVEFVYYQKERLSLEADKTALNEAPNVKIKELLGSVSKELHAQLLKDGVPTKDIVEMLVAPATEEMNTFASKLLRKPKVLKIPFETEGNGNDIFFMYGGLCHLIADGVALSPEEHSEYLTYKMVLEHENLTDSEKKEIFDDKGVIVNQEVAYYWLMWRKEAGRLTEKNEADLTKLSRNRTLNRFALADKELQSMGLSFEKLTKDHPEKAALLFKRILDFHELRYNVVGKHLMYLSFESFLHIYLRHVKELSVDNQFDERSKFQLAEKDLKATMNIVLSALNDEYQKYKDEHPDNRFFRKGNMAYYYNGDYYDVDIKQDGQIGTFYKRVEREGNTDAPVK